MDNEILLQCECHSEIVLVDFDVDLVWFTWYTCSAHQQTFWQRTKRAWWFLRGRDVSRNELLLDDTEARKLLVWLQEHLADGD